MFGKKEIAELKAQMKSLDYQLSTANDVIERGKEANEKQQKEIGDLRQTEFKLKEEYQRKEEHATALLQIEQEKEIHRQVSTVKDEYNEKEKNLLENNFQKLGDSLEELHKKGNANTKFVEKTSLKMMDVMAQLAGTKLEKSNLFTPEVEVIAAPKKFKNIDGVAREIFHCDIDKADWYIDADGDECWVD